MKLFTFLIPLFLIASSFNSAKHECGKKCLADISVEWNPRIENNVLTVDWKIDFNGHDPFTMMISYR